MSCGAELQGLAFTCSELGRSCFYFVLGAVPRQDATGVTVNSLAIF